MKSCMFILIIKVMGSMICIIVLHKNIRHVMAIHCKFVCYSKAMLFKMCCINFVDPWQITIASIYQIESGIVYHFVLSPSKKSDFRFSRS
jgi:hypothetical protein